MRETLTAETAKQFQGYSAMNAASILAVLHCDCEPYRDVFTYQRWQAQGFQVRKGEHGVRITTWIEASEKREPEAEPEAERKVYRLPRAVVVFCRCQVDAKGGRAYSNSDIPGGQHIEHFNAETGLE